MQWSNLLSLQLLWRISRMMENARLDWKKMGLSKIQPPMGLLLPAGSHPFLSFPLLSLA